MAQQKQTEAQMLREYLKIKNARQKYFLASLRTLIEKSELTLSEAAPIYKLIDEEEKELWK